MEIQQIGEKAMYENKGKKKKYRRGNGDAEGVGNEDADSVTDV